MDAIEILTRDHRRVDELFLRYQPLAGDSSAARERKRVVKEITRELSVHADIEERELYPVVRESVPSGESMADEAAAEHAQMKATLAELEDLDPASPDYDAGVARLIEEVRHHVGEEEGELFPKLRDAVGETRLDEIGVRLERARKTAPKRPGGPPSKGAAALVADAATSAFSRVRKAIGEVTGLGAAAKPRRRRTSAKKGSRSRSGRSGRGRTKTSRRRKATVTTSRSRTGAAKPRRAVNARKTRSRTASRKTRTGAAARSRGKNRASTAAAKRRRTGTRRATPAKARARKASTRSRAR